MDNRIELLEESRNSWQESAEHDKKQFLASFAMTATGAFLTGVGTNATIDKDVRGGITGIAIGAIMAISSAKVVMEEIHDFAEMSARANTRQQQINEIADKSQTNNF